MTDTCQNFLMVSVTYGQGWILGGEMRGMHLPTSHFQKNFDVYNFSIILNLFDSNKLYALRTQNRKCANKMHHNWRSNKN